MLHQFIKERSHSNPLLLLVLRKMFHRTRLLLWKTQDLNDLSEKNKTYLWERSWLCRKTGIIWTKKNKFCLKNRICLQKHSVPETVWRNGLICLSTHICTFFYFFWPSSKWTEPKCAQISSKRQKFKSFQKNNTHGLKLRRIVKLSC